MENKLTLDFIIIEESRLTWLGIDDLKSLLDYATKYNNSLTSEDSTELHDYWWNVIVKTESELLKKIYEIFPPES